jgi:hypothetical protein
MRAQDIIENLTRPRGKQIVNRIQSNLLGYRVEWNTVIWEMFRNHMGTSLDYPNLYRRVVGQGPETYNQLWLDRFQEAAANRIDIAVISIPNYASFELGAAAFYSYFFNEIGLTSLQLNTAFPGGLPNAAKSNFPLAPEKASQFYMELIDLWLERGYSNGIYIRPFDVLIS